MEQQDSPALSVATLATLVGRQFEPTEWITVDQARIDAFAELLALYIARGESHRGDL